MRTGELSCAILELFADWSRFCFVFLNIQSNHFECVNRFLLLLLSCLLPFMLIIVHIHPHRRNVEIKCLGFVCILLPLH